MPMRDTDTILGPPRGSAEEALDFARDIGAKRRDQVERYIREVYKLAPRVGIDPAIVVAQSALETNNWRDEKWNRKLNAAGIGVTDDLDHGFGWDNGAASARGQIVHLWLYAKGTTLPDALAEFKALDPRWDAAVDAGFAGGSPTLASLRWASVEDYGQRIARRSRDIFANLPNQGAPAPRPAAAPPSLPIKKDFIPSSKPNRRKQKFDVQELFITVHETNNPNSHTEGEANFFQGGGGDKRVAVHFVVDEDRAVQLLPLDERGKHSDEGGPGDRTSVAIETCVATDLDFDKVRRNLAQLIALIAAGHEILDWGSGTTRDRFSRARVRMHHDWSPRNPCPRHIRAERFWDRVMGLVTNAAAEIGEIGGIFVEPHEPPPFDGTEKTINGVVFHPFKKQVTSKGVNRREWATPDARLTGPLIPAGTKIPVLYWVEGEAVDGNNVWLIGESGSRIWSGGVEEPVP